MDEICENCGHYASQHQTTEPDSMCRVIVISRGRNKFCPCPGLITESTM